MRVYALVAAALTFTVGVVVWVLRSQKKVSIKSEEENLSSFLENLSRKAFKEKP